MLRRPFPVVGKCNSMQKRYGARQAVNVHSLRTGGVFAVQRPRDMALGGQGDVAHMAENNTGVVVLHPGHGGDQVLQIQRRLGHPQQQQLELPVVHLDAVGIQLYQSAHGGAVAHGPEDEIPLENLAVRLDAAVVGPQGVQIAQPLQDIREVSQCVFRRLRRGVG